MKMTSPRPVISLKGLTKHYGRFRGVEELDLEVYAGEIFGFLGPNGAGKTTTIRILNGLLRPNRGSALILGLDSWKDSVLIASKVGYQPDVGGIYGEMTGHEFLDYMGGLDGTASVLRSELCDLLALNDRDLGRGIKGYSKGMRQKLMIVQALQHDPDLVMMDEPTEGLDPLMQEALFQILLSFRAKGRTIFFSSHILSEVERLCDRVGFIREGKLVAVEEIEELRSKRRRKLVITLATDQELSPLELPGVINMTREGRQVRMLFQGETNRLLRALAQLNVEDFTFEQLHLEDIFLEYYRPEAHKGDGKGLP